MAEKKEKKAKAPRKTTKAKTPAKAVAAPIAAEPAPVIEKIAPKPKKLNSKTSYYGTGRRKESIAKVWLVPGSGKILVNGREFNQYFCNRKVLEYKVLRPLIVTNTRESYDVIADALGGGIPGQAGAVCLGIARALLALNPELKKTLRKEGLLTRDPRMKERKKYGLKRARRAFQFTKR